MKVRFVYPQVNSNGLGNNFQALAKAHLIAETCKMNYQPPVWPPCEHVKPPTPNGYGYYFPVTFADSIRLKLADYQFRIQEKLPLQLWPTLYFNREVYERIGIDDAGESCLIYLKEHGLDDPEKSVVVTTSGMWGGYPAIRRARNWIGELFMSHADTRSRVLEVEQRTSGKLRIAVQIRMGDFVAREASGPIQEGERVVRLPLEWYSKICRQIRELCDCEFILITDGTQEELQEFLDEFDPINTIDEPYRDLLGVMLMGRADFVVCSNSTYSRMGVFLNDKPYIWPSDTLVKDATGKYGFLFKNEANPALNGNGFNREAVRRCFALRIDFNTFPEGLVRYFDSGCKLKVEMANDLLYNEPVVLL